jgi:hypothetical protein
VGAFEWHYPSVFAKEGGLPVYEEKTIAELILKIPYERTSYEMRWGETSHITIFEALFILVLGTSFESVGKLKLNKESVEWHKWDRELKFLSVEPFVAPVMASSAAGTGAGAGAGPLSFGGARSRLTRRWRSKRRSSRSKKRRANC